MPRQIPRDPERAKRMAVARQYKRDGYRVADPERGDAIPPFLDGTMPDLVAQREDDRVVVEIKQVDRVAGSNDLVALAERVERQVGWRLELIAVPAPVEVDLIAEGSLDGGVVDQLTKQGAFRAAYLLKFAELENVLSWAAVAEGRRLARDLPAVAGDLVFVGALPSDMLPGVRTASAVRNTIVHGTAAAAPDRDDVLRLSELVEHIRREIGVVRAA